MSLHSAIMKLTPETTIIDNDTIVTLKYNGKVYKGFAFCHREDADFYSEIVGATIAHLRALIKIYDDEIVRAEQTAITLWSAYKDVIYNSQTEGVPADPTGAFLDRVSAAQNLVFRYKDQQQTLKKRLRSYLANQDKCISNIKAQREANKDKID